MFDFKNEVIRSYFNSYANTKFLIDKRIAIRTLQHIKKINELYSDDKISLVTKSKLNNEIVEWQMMTSKQRKWQRKL